MKKICSFLILLAAIGVCVGLYRGWFTVSGGREAESQKVDVNLTVDPDRVKADAEALKEKTRELTGRMTEGASP